MTERDVSTSESAPVCGCGLPMSRNPHPDAGKPSQAGVEVGYVWECIPCLVKTRNRVGRQWRAAQQRIDMLRAVLLECRDWFESPGGDPDSGEILRRINEARAGDRRD